MPNWWMAALVAAYFEELRAVLGDDMPRRFHDEQTGDRLWSMLPPSAGQTPELREALLAFIREHGTAGSPTYCDSCPACVQAVESLPTL